MRGLAFMPARHVRAGASFASLEGALSFPKLALLANEARRAGPQVADARAGLAFMPARYVRA